MGFFRRLTRRVVKITGLGVTVVGGAALANCAINEDLDDISYFFKRWIYKPTRSSNGQLKSVVVLGSGWGALSFVRKLDPREYRVTVVSPRPFFFYTPLLVGSTTGTVSPGAIIEPIRDQVSGVDFLRVPCTDVDLEQRKVTIGGGAEPTVTLDYDHLVVAVGAQPNTFGIPGVAEHACFLKEVEHGRKVRAQLMDNIEKAEVALKAGQVERVKQLLHFVVVGGGPTGVEFCGELSDFINKDLVKKFPNIAGYMKVTLVEALPGLLTMFHKDVGGYVVGHLESQGVTIRCNAMVKEATADNVQIKLKDGTVEQLDYGLLVWVAGVGMRPFTKALCEQIGKDKGQTDRRGLVVDECLRVRGTQAGEVFAIGDCAVSGKPPTAQVAAQQGKYLGRMFRVGSQHLISSSAAPPFEYNNKGTMAYIGSGEAAAQISPDNFIKLGRSSLTDHFWWRALYGDDNELRIMGQAGFAIWRSVYFSKLYSTRNRWSVASDWMRCSWFGRPAASSAQGTMPC